MNPRTVTLRTTLLLLAATYFAYACVMLSPLNPLFFSPFYATPYLITFLLARYQQRGISQIILLLTSLIHGAWIVYLFVAALILYPDPQSPIGLVFGGIASLLVLFPLWIIASGLNYYYVNKEITRPGTARGTASSPAP